MSPGAPMERIVYCCTTCGNVYTFAIATFHSGSHHSANAKVFYCSGMSKPAPDWVQVAYKLTGTDALIQYSAMLRKSIACPSTPP